MEPFFSERFVQVERFWAKVDRSAGWEGCWPWQRAMTAGGHGMAHFMGRTGPAHRVAYELANGPIPEGLHIDHLCRNRACCNPDHLEAVAPGENLRRGRVARATTP